MPDATIIVTIGPYHKHLANRAIESARAQTWPTTVVTAYDEKGLGPGRARNMALRMVNTNFVVFLDADDLVEPTFVAKCLRVWQPDHYVYTDWREGDKVVTAPDCPWHQQEWHVITTLLPTLAARRTRFDEDLPGAEDRDFYLNLTRNGTCGIHLPEPLFTYGADGKRGTDFHASRERDAVLIEINERYTDMAKKCCGGDKAGVAAVAVEGKQDGDIEVMAMWGGNRDILGPMTARRYPRVSRPKRFFAAVADVEMWMKQGLVLPVRRKEAPPPLPVLDGVRALGQVLYRTEYAAPKLVIPDVEIKPDVQRVLRLYRQAVEL